MQSRRYGIRRPHTPKPRHSKFDSGDSIGFVRCRICGKHLRLVSGSHLRIHGTDRETYMLEYRLSPDKLCSKFFRVNHSSRRDYCPHGKPDWIAAIHNRQRNDSSLLTWDARGNWRGFIPGVRDRQRYMFYIVGDGGEGATFLT